MVEKKDRKKHSEKQCGEPWIDRTWMRFRDTSLDRKRSDMELEAEFETDGDLKKSIPQLVCEFNLEIPKLPIGRSEERILLTAQSRMVAMMAKVAVSNDRMARALIGLTMILVILTIILVFKG